MHKTQYSILPSLLSADTLHLADEISAIIKAGADHVHLDVMDNHYVPNLTFGSLICQQIRQQFPLLSIDVHLTVSPVDSLIEQFAQSGANRISIHPDATIHLDASLQRIKQLGCQAGLVLNPSTPLNCLDWCVHRLDFVLLMMVNPGFASQTLLPEMIHKITLLHAHYQHLPICVDGGVSLDNIHSLACAGASEFVAGSAIFHRDDYAKTIQTLRQHALRG